jgi:hypothetical protein
MNDFDNLTYTVGCKESTEGLKNWTQNTIGIKADYTEWAG